MSKSPWRSKRGKDGKVKRFKVQLYHNFKSPYGTDRQLVLNNPIKAKQKAMNILKLTSNMGDKAGIKKYKMALISASNKAKAQAKNSELGDEVRQKFLNSSKIYHEIASQVGMKRNYISYESGKSMTLEEVVEGQRALEDAQAKYEEFEGWAHCSGPKEAFIPENDLLLEYELEGSDLQYFPSGIIVTKEEVEDMFEMETGKPLYQKIKKITGWNKWDKLWLASPTDGSMRATTKDGKSIIIYDTRVRDKWHMRFEDREYPRGMVEMSFPLKDFRTMWDAMKFAEKLRENPNNYKGIKESHQKESENEINRASKYLKKLQSDEKWKNSSTGARLYKARGIYNLTNEELKVVMKKNGIKRWKVFPVENKKENIIVLAKTKKEAIDIGSSHHDYAGLSSKNFDADNIKL